jgi:hypothetical protein
MQRGMYQTNEGTFIFLTGEKDLHGFIGERYNGTVKYLSAKEIDELKPIFATHGSPQVSNPRAWIQERKKEANWLENKLNDVLAQSQP